MHHHTLLRTLPIVAKMLGRRAGIEVKVGGDRAFTNGESIVIPSLDPRDEEAEILAYGYLGHEIGHVHHTDFEYVNDLQKKEKWSPLKESLHNTFEDIFIEKKEAEKYPGIRTDIACLCERLVNDGTMKGLSDKDSPAVVLQRYLIYRMRSEILGQSALDQLAREAEKIFRSQVSKGFAAKVGSLIGRVPALDSTQDTLAITDELLRILKEEKAEKPPEGGEGGEGDETPSSETNEAGQGKDGPSSRVDMQSVAEAILNAESNDLDKDLGQMVKEKLDQKAEEAERSVEGGMGAGVAVADPPQQLTVDPTELIARARAATNALRVRLGGLVESSLEEDECLGRSGLFIDNPSVYRTVLGDGNVFMTEDEETGVNTAFVILFDRSGSMSRCIVTAREAALAVSLALNEIPGVSVTCAAFPSHLSPTGVLLLTHFGEAPLKTAGRYEAVNASGGTPMTEALWWGACELSMREEPRKIILVVTDGNPDRLESCRDTIRIISGTGVELLGLGINSQSVVNLFPVHAVIDNSTELASAMFGMLQSTLLAQAA